MIVAVLLLGGSAAVAGGPRFNLPIPRPPAKAKSNSGLRLTIDGRGVEGNGYRPIRIEVTPWPLKPLPADRQLRVVLNKPSLTFTASSPTVEQIIELPEGSMGVTTTISVPQSTSWYAMKIDTYEGGEWLEDLSQSHIGWPNGHAWNLTEAQPAMLFIDSNVPPRMDRDVALGTYRTTAADPTPTYTLPDVRQLTLVLHDPNSGPGSTPPAITAAMNSPAQRISDTALLAFIDGLPRTEMLPPAELPNRWIDLSQYDVVFVSLAELQGLAATHPAAFGALRDWLSTGHLLVVRGAGDQFQRLAEIERLLKLPALTADDARPEYRGWTAPVGSDNKSELHSPFYNGADPAMFVRRGTFSRQVKASQSIGTDALATETSQTKPIPDSPTGPLPFLTRRAGLGSVAAIAADQPFPGQGSDWIWLFNSVPDNHWRWFRRNGFSLHRSNKDYWTLLISGVGQAPVISFMLLVSLFALVIGPLNYVMLGRSRRLYLLLITVPAGAGLVTISLFSYALVIDGLGVRLRSRSFTELNQPAGEAAVWSWQSYYAAIAPSKGLIYPEDTTVFPVKPEPEWDGGRAGGMSGWLRWDEGQCLESGYLSSRTATQLMVQRATKTEARLVVHETNGTTAGGPLAENRLQSNIRYLLLRDRNGDYFTASDLAVDSQANLVKVEPATAKSKLDNLAQAVTPADLRKQSAVGQSTLSFLVPFHRSWGGDAGAGEPLMNASLLETSISVALNPTKHPLENGTYIAVVERPPFVPVGVPQVREEGSLHVIRGRY